MNEKFSSVIRLRIFIIALPIIVLNNIWVLTMEKVKDGPYPTTISILANVLFILAIIAGLNSLLARWKPAWALSWAEMMLLYSMLAISSVLSGHDMLPTAVGLVAYPHWFATPENRWLETFIPSLPKWLVISDREALKGLWAGGSNLYKTGYWKLWVIPTLFWLAFTIVLVWVMMCINTLVRKQWTDRERLSFPIVQLPLAMTEPRGEIWRNKLFWIGFAIAFSIDFINGLTVYFPAIPKIAFGFETYDLGAGLTARPWNAIGWTPLSFYPFVIGLGYLLPTDLIFSCWFFYWFWKAQRLISAMFGWDSIPDFPYIRHQVIGGIAAIIVTLAWTSKGYLKQVWAKVMGRQSELDDSDEPMSYRAAVIGILIGIAILSFFMQMLGMSAIVAIIAFIIYFVIALGIARIRAELGPPVHDMHFSGPDFVITSTAGIGRLSEGNLVGLAYLYWFNRAYRGHPMPHAIEGMKCADATRGSQKKFLWGMMIAVAVGTIVTFWYYVDIGYRLGWGVGVGSEGGNAYGAVRNLDYWWSRPEDMLKPNWNGSLAMLLGFAFCMLLSYVRLNLLNWPFNPIGFVISGSYQINLVWMPLFIAWLIKVNILKFGGIKLFREGIPFFLGLILGEMIIGCTWSLVGFIFNVPYYNFWGA